MSEKKSIDTNQQIEGDENEYAVEEIRKHKKGKNGVTYFLIKWKDYDESENTWEPEENLIGSIDLLNEYWSKYKSKNEKSNLKIENKQNYEETELKLRNKQKLEIGETSVGKHHEEHVEKNLLYRKEKKEQKNTPASRLDKKNERETTSSNNTKVKYVQFIGGSRKFGKLMFVCNVNGQVMNISYDEAKKNYPEELMDYFVEHMSFVPKK